MKTRQISEFKETEIGKIPEDWELKQLQEISTVIDSAHITPKYSTDGYSMVRVKDIKKGFLDLSETLKVSKKVYEEFTKNHIPKKNDIVMGRVGTYGVVSYVDTDIPFCLGQNTVVINSSINQFIFHALNSKLVQNQIEERVGGSTQKTISLKDIRELLVAKPTKSEEINHIAKILFNQEFKIQNLQNQNKILEQITTTIFKSWFVDFDGVTEFEDSELGQIPKGWKVLKFSDVVEIMGGGTPSTKYEEYWNGEIKWVTIDDIKQGCYISDTEKKITKIGMEKSSAKILPKNTIVISARGTVGIFSILSEPMSINQSCYGLKGKNIENEIYLYFLLRFSLLEFLQKVHGTVFDTITRKTFEEITIICPPDEKIELFQNYMKPIFQMILKNQLQIQQLGISRDILLPKLMSGEIRV